jgi:glycosyltransferase involved in cell wall biosynthesis
MRIDSLIRFLAIKVDLTVVFMGPLATETGIAVGMRYGVKFILLESKGAIFPEEYGMRLSLFLADHFFDSIIVEYIHNTNFVYYLLYDCKLILDIHDITSERFAEFDKFGYGDSIMELDETTELEILDIYDHILVLCENDLRFLAARLGSEKLLLCGYSPEAIPLAPKQDVRSISFVGSEYLPNRDAIQNFISHCWPMLQERFDISLRVYGNVCKSLDYPLLPGVHPMGFVADIDKIYAATDIIINPVRFGAGVKIKTIEALAHGLPLVVTPHGARGLEEYANEAFLVADSDLAFVEILSKLITDSGARADLHMNARRLIDRCFRPEICYGPLLAVLMAD